MCTWIAVSISSDDNHYFMSASFEALSSFDDLILAVDDFLNNASM